MLRQTTILTVATLLTIGIASAQADSYRSKQKKARYHNDGPSAQHVRSSRNHFVAPPETTYEPRKRYKKRRHYVRYHDNGRIAEKGFFRRGKRVGLHKKWYPNGRRQFVGKYRNGYKHGVHKRFYRNGRLKSVKTFRWGTQQSIQTKWYRNGHMKSKIAFRNGRKHGWAIHYAANGYITKRQRFRYGYPERHHWRNQRRAHRVQTVKPMPLPRVAYQPTRYY